MEVGFIQKASIFPNFVQVTKPNRQKVEKLTQTDPSFLLKEGSPTNLIDSKLDASQDKKVSNVKPSEHFGLFTEVKLSNEDFGFNDGTKDFFVKVSRGTFVDSKYPTDDMLRLKAYLNKLDDGNVA